MDSIFALLPSSIQSPLLQLFNLDASNLTNSIIPILISLFTLYFAVLSFYSTIRYTIKLGLFCIKWATIIIAGLSIWTSLTGNSIPLAGSGMDVAKTALNLGMKGVQYYTGLNLNPTKTNLKSSRNTVPTNYQDDSTSFDTESITSILSSLGIINPPPPPPKTKKSKSSNPRTPKPKESKPIQADGMNDVVVQFLFGKAKSMWNELVVENLEKSKSKRPK